VTILCGEAGRNSESTIGNQQSTIAQPDMKDTNGSEVIEIPV
jgi:hypothetical protein